MTDSSPRLPRIVKTVNPKPNPRRTTHGALVGGKCPPEYDAWRQMKARCFNTNHRHYKDYGGRGITVCIRWRHSFPNFLSDMGKRPSKKHSIDRIRNNGNYTPKNCRWAIDKIQNNNTRKNRVLTHNRKSLSVSQWAHRLSIPVQTIFKRIRLGWTIERILSK